MIKYSAGEENNQEFHAGLFFFLFTIEKKNHVKAAVFFINYRQGKLNHAQKAYILNCLFLLSLKSLQFGFILFFP